MTKPEIPYLKEMVLSLLKSKSVFENQIAANLRELLKLKNVCKCLSGQYLKEDYSEKVIAITFQLLVIMTANQAQIEIDSLNLKFKEI